jgi:hypothetical protein
LATFAACNAPAGGDGAAAADQAEAPRDPRRAGLLLAHSLRAYAPMEPFLALAAGDLTAAHDAQETSFNRTFTARWRAQHSSYEQMQLLMAGMAWFRTRALADANADCSMYEARISTVNAEVLQQWRAQTPSGLAQATPNDDALLQLAVMFLEPLWDGAVLKPGQPQQALTRLAALPPELVDQLSSASRQETKFVAAYTLITTDEFYRDDVLQVDWVVAALPEVTTAFAEADSNDRVQ